MRSREEFEEELRKQKRGKDPADWDSRQLTELQYRLRIVELEEKNKKLNDQMQFYKLLSEMFGKALSLS